MSRNDESIEARINALLAEDAAGKQFEGQHGCCRITWDGGYVSKGNVTRERCEEIADEVGGTAKWSSGPC